MEKRGYGTDNCRSTVQYTRHFPPPVASVADPYRTRIVLPDRDRHSEHAGLVSIPSTCFLYFFHENLNMLSKIFKIIAHLPLMRKEKHSKLRNSLNWHCYEQKSKKFELFSKICTVELGVGSACGSALFWCQSLCGSGSDLDRRRKGKSDPDLHRKDDDPQHCLLLCVRYFLQLYCIT